MKLALKIALRFLSTSKSQTLFIVLGIAIGVSVQVFIGLLIQGLQANLIQKTVGNSSQITIRSNTGDKTISNYENIIKQIEGEEFSSSLKNISPVMETPGIIRVDGVDNSAFIRGFNFERAKGLYQFESKLIKGRMPTGLNEIIIGQDLFDELKLQLNQTISVVIPPLILLPKTLTIVGIFDFGVSAINNSWLISNIGTVQTLALKPNVVSAIEMQVNEVFEADILAQKIEETLRKPELKYSNWKKDNEQLLDALTGQTASSLMIQVFVIIAVSLAIASVLAISVVQKSKQLGILKAMGIKDRQASMAFLFQGTILGVIGAIIGVILGIGLVVMFTVFARNSDGTAVVPVYINYGFILISILIAILSSTIAAIIPAQRSSKLTPVEVIRNG